MQIAQLLLHALLMPGHGMGCSLEGFDERLAWPLPLCVIRCCKHSYGTFLVDRGGEVEMAVEVKVAAESVAASAQRSMSTM